MCKEEAYFRDFTGCLVWLRELIEVHQENRETGDLSPGCPAFRGSVFSLWLWLIVNKLPYQSPQKDLSISRLESRTYLKSLGWGEAGPT